jgi:putative nucleotidyltransferase with HDIG domain
MRIQNHFKTDGSIEVILEQSASHLLQLIPFRGVAFFLFQEDHIGIESRYVHPIELKGAVEREIAQQIDTGSFAQALKKAGSLLIPADQTKHGNRIILSPLATENGTSGMFCGVLHAGEELPDQGFLSLLDLVLLSTSLAMESKLLYQDVRSRNCALQKQEELLKLSFENLRTAMEGTIRTLSMMGEVRDPYTAGHQERVSRIAQAIGKELGLPEEEIEGIRVSGALHDIGKMQIPTEILCKPGKLTDLEFKLIQTHVQVGYDILKQITFPWQVAEIVRQHHERMDGSGYPQGLTGDDILLEARILGVADTVEAMVSHRPYRPRVGLEKTISAIAEGSGRLYDAEVADACLRLLQNQTLDLG